MAGAMTAAAGATGIRAWLAARRPSWLTPRVLRRVTIVLIVTAVVLSGALFSGRHASTTAQSASDAMQQSVR
jgi:hypothetical protein